MRNYLHRHIYSIEKLATDSASTGVFAVGSCLENADEVSRQLCLQFQCNTKPLVQKSRMYDMNFWSETTPVRIRLKISPLFAHVARFGREKRAAS
jgi:hypothetical protein